MIKFKAKDLKRRGDVFTLNARAETQGQFVVLVGTQKGEGDARKMQVYCLMTSPRKGPVILEQSKGAIPAFNVLITINRALTAWHNTDGPRPNAKEAQELSRARIKTIMRFARLLSVGDMVADKTEFEAHFG